LSSSQAATTTYWKTVTVTLGKRLIELHCLHKSGDIIFRYFLQTLYIALITLDILGDLLYIVIYNYYVK